MISFKNLQKAILIAGIAGVMAGSAGLASAQTPAHDSNWEKTHPRRDEVNDRLANQNKRIKKEVREGEMSKAKAAKLHREDRRIRKEERIMASQHNGHITKAEKAQLNKQENAVSRQIGK
jgi:hypothetical protein